MIRVYKSPEPHKDKVEVQLLVDQHKKCYLCERLMGTDYQKEHLRSQAHNIDGIEKWSNWLVACSYCNGKKSDKFDDILNPTLHNIEELIKHGIDYSNGKIVLSSDETSTAVHSTIALLHRLFNGTSGIRKNREREFYDEFIRKMNNFSWAIDDYIDDQTEKHRLIIEQHLSIKAEYLGFKYAIIHSQPLLKQDFAHLTIWNKQ